MDVKEYRAQILKILIDTKDEKGNQRMEEDVAKDLLDSFSDEELMDGIEFLTPQDVADVLLEQE